MMEEGLSAATANARAIRSATRLLRGQAGVISIDRRGRIAAAHNTKFMPWAYSTARMKMPKGYIRGRIVDLLS
jgi:isoaspartyl peptidase/L-asparaginase-like protein (Ntn-hydrolase superfamily)